MQTIEAYFDGACEPCNPGGTASFGAVVFQGGKRIWDCSRLFNPLPGRESETSNNVAEYSGLISILEFLSKSGLNKQPIIIRGDSMLVVKQMGGRWRIKKGFYVPLARQAKKMLSHFPNLEITWVPRDKNGIADELSKAELKKAGVVFKLQPE